MRSVDEIIGQQRSSVLSVPAIVVAMHCRRCWPSESVGEGETAVVEVLFDSFVNAFRFFDGALCVTAGLQPNPNHTVFVRMSVFLMTFAYWFRSF